MKLLIDSRWPCIVDVGVHIENRPVTLADDGKRLEHIVQDHAVRLRHGEFAANRIESAVNAYRRAADRLARPDPLFITPIDSADHRGGAIVTFLAQNQFAGHAANLRIGKIIHQLLNSAWSYFRPDVYKENDLRCCLRHAGVDGNRLASVLLIDDGDDTRLTKARKHFRCSICRSVRNNNDLFDVRVIKTKQVLDLAREQGCAVMHRHHDAYTGKDGANNPRPWPQPRKQPHHHGVSQIGIENACLRQPEDDSHWAPLHRRMVFVHLAIELYSRSFLAAETQRVGGAEFAVSGIIAISSAIEKSIFSKVGHA